MIEDAKKVPLNFFFEAPSCVPATNFESNGVNLDYNEIRKLPELKEIKYLAEMMDLPGVIFDDADFILVDILSKMNSQETLIKGKKMFAKGKVLFRYKERSTVNNFNWQPVTDSDIFVKNKHGEIRINVTVEGELLTSEMHGSSQESEFVTPDISNDVLKIGDRGLFDVRKFEAVSLFV